MLPRICLITTGGTISMRFDPELGGAVPAVKGRELLKRVTAVGEVAHVSLREFANIPSPYITPEKMFELCRVIDVTLARPDVDGVVVTHGTDALEESAYMSDLYVDSPKTLVFTAAMLNDSDVGADGPRNLLGAVRVATCPDARGLGSLIVFNSRVLAARDTIKMHTSNLDAFRSPMLGPMGNIDDDVVTIYRRSMVRQTIRPEQIEPRVEMVRVYAGMDSSLLFWALDKGKRGLVIEAMGQGNVPPTMLPGLQAWIDAGRPVVIVSRCPEGRVIDNYAYEGGGKQLRHMGVIFGEDLRGPKARIKLMLALGMTDNLEQIRRLFEHLT